MRRWRRICALVGLALGAGLMGCGGYESAYERAVYNAEPVYCYRTLATPDCWLEPDPSALPRLVNYYGPSPRRTEAAAPDAIRLEPPPEALAARGEGARAPTRLSAEASRPGGAEPGEER